MMKNMCVFSSHNLPYYRRSKSNILAGTAPHTGRENIKGEWRVCGVERFIYLGNEMSKKGKNFTFSVFYCTRERFCKIHKNSTTLPSFHFLVIFSAQLRAFIQWYFLCVCTYSTENWERIKLGKWERERERVIAKYREWELSAKFMQYNEHTSSRPREREREGQL